MQRKNIFRGELFGAQHITQVRIRNAFSLHMNAANALFSRLARTCAEGAAIARRENPSRALYESSPIERTDAHRFDLGSSA
jgi:hypothetical protein